MAEALNQIGAQTETATPYPRLWDSIRIPVYAGLAIVVGFFGVFGSWATLAPLDSAAVAPGVVRVEGSRKTVQHLEGGIISEILVKAGDRVKAGQALIRLDDTPSKANLKLLQGRLYAALALEARLVAERDGKTEITFPETLIEKRNDPKIDEIITGQINIFNARLESLSGKENILKLRSAQLDEEITGLKGQIKAEDKQLSLIADEIADVSGLVKKGLAPKPRLLSLQRRQAEIEGSRSNNHAQIARARQSIAETRLQISELRTTAINEAVEQVRDVQNDLGDLSEKVRAAKDVLSRIEIRAPQDGAVVNLQVHTPGGVIAPGEPLLDIVPLDVRLIVEARVDPKDIDVVRPGLASLIRLTAFSQRRTKPLEGRVLTVSADVLRDERTGLSYYLARIEIIGNQDAALGGSVIQPGMQADVMIVTGERTLFEYIIGPVESSFNRAFRED